MARRDPSRSRSFRGRPGASASRSGPRRAGRARRDAGAARRGEDGRGRRRKRLPRCCRPCPAWRGRRSSSSRIAVRGGGPDENLTVMDGVEIHNPYRLFGLTSAFNPETVESFELSAGGFGAAYGDRLSSLLVVQNREGSEREGPHRLRRAQPHGRERRSWRARCPAARAPGCSPAAAPTTTSWPSASSTRTCPRSTTCRPACVLRLGGGRTLSLFGLRSREATRRDLRRPRGRGQGAFFTRTRNDSVAAALRRHRSAGAGVMRTTASAYTNTDVVDFGGDFRNEARRSNAPATRPSARAASSSTWDEHACATSRCARSCRLQAGRAPRARGRGRAAPPAHARRLRDPRRPQPDRGQQLEPGRRRGACRTTLDSSRSTTRLGAWLQDRVSLSRGSPCSPACASTAAA